MTKLISTSTLQFCVLFSYKLHACNMTSYHHIQALFHSGWATCTTVSLAWLHASTTKYENCALLGYHAEISGNLLPMFWDYLSVPFLGVKNPNVKMGPIGCPKTLVRNYHYMLHSNKEKRSS